MGFRFFRRMNIALGVRLNFSKSGISPSFGVRGARVTLGRSGIRRTVGIPGTGLFYTDVTGFGRKRSRKRKSRRPEPKPQHKLDLGFFERLFTPRSERAFVDGCKAYVGGGQRVDHRGFGCCSQHGATVGKQSRPCGKHRINS